VRLSMQALGRQKHPAHGIRNFSLLRGNDALADREWGAGNAGRSDRKTTSPKGTNEEDLTTAWGRIERRRKGQCCSKNLAARGETIKGNKKKIEICRQGDLKKPSHLQEEEASSKRANDVLWSLLKGVLKSVRRRVGRRDERIKKTFYWKKPFLRILGLRNSVGGRRKPVFVNAWELKRRH